MSPPMNLRHILQLTRFIRSSVTKHEMCVFLDRVEQSPVNLDMSRLSGPLGLMNVTSTIRYNSGSTMVRRVLEVLPKEQIITPFADVGYDEDNELYRKTLC